jgi:hypothetical protein
VSPALFATSNNITSVTVGGSANTVSLTFDSNGVITGASNNALSVANTQITGNITSSQITSNPTLYGNVSVTGAIGVGGATPTSNGSGITFPATQSASSDANTLDDYEEGTWTPTVTPSSGSLTAYTSSATYVKIGKLVTVNIVVGITTVGTSGSYFKITNLPITPDMTLGSIAAYGREYNITGFALSLEIAPGPLLFWQKYDGTFLGANGYAYSITCVYRAT